jgi:hypothetical protein
VNDLWQNFIMCMVELDVMGATTRMNYYCCGHYNMTTCKHNHLLGGKEDLAI